MELGGELSSENQHKSMESDEVQNIGVSSPGTGHVSVKDTSDSTKPPLLEGKRGREREE